MDDGASLATVARAVERGVSWIDTAPLYGRGHAETVVGRALHRLPSRERPVVVTKAGLSWGARGRPVRDTAPSSLRRDCEASLIRLGVEALDVLLLHWPPDDGSPVEDAWQALLDLQSAGKAGHVGLCNCGPDLLERCAVLGPVAFLQVPFSLLNRRIAGDGTLAWCAANGTAVLAYAPLEAGLLAGRYVPASPPALRHDDWRGANPEWQGERLTRNLRLQEKLRRIAAEAGLSAPALAIAWVSSWPEVHAAVAGARRPADVDGWAAALAGGLDAATVGQVAEALAVTGAGEGPVRPGPGSRA